MRVALALSGGGARGAYQVGALRALAELFPDQRQTPFSILVGASAGAITSSFLAARANAFPHGVARLVDFWSHIRPEDVFRTDAPTLAKGGLKWVADLSLGGWIGRHREKSLLRSDPLQTVLEARLDMEAVREHIERGTLHGIALTATDYRTNLAVTFFDGAPRSPPDPFDAPRGSAAPHDRSRHGIERYSRFLPGHTHRREVLRGRMPAVDGTSQPREIHLGADRILAIGIRSPGIRERPVESADGGTPIPPSPTRRACS